MGRESGHPGIFDPEFFAELDAVIPRLFHLGDQAHPGVDAVSRPAAVLNDGEVGQGEGLE